MPDLTGVLFDWNATLAVEQLDVVLAALAGLHAHPWADAGALPAGAPWCPLPERIALICRSSLERPGPARDAVAERLLPGWDLFDRLATPAARDVVAALSDDPGPLVRGARGPARDADPWRPEARERRDRRRRVGRGRRLADGHGRPGRDRARLVPRLERQRPAAAGRGGPRALPRGRAAPLDDAGADLAILVGLLLRGWRKGYDAEAGITLASGVAAADDLAWWCDRAVEAAGRL